MPDNLSLAQALAKREEQKLLREALERGDIAEFNRITAERAKQSKSPEQASLQEALASNDIAGFNEITARLAAEKTAKLEAEDPKAAKQAALRRALDRDDIEGFNAINAESRKGHTREPDFSPAHKRAILVQQAEEQLTKNQAPDPGADKIRAALQARAEQQLRQHEREKVSEQMHAVRRYNAMRAAEEELKQSKDLANPWGGTTLASKD